MSNESSVKNLLNGVEFDDSRMYTLLDQLITDFYKLQNQINPPTSARVFGTTGAITTPGVVDSFTVILYNNNVKLIWLILPGIHIYEIRYKAGNRLALDWDTASVLLRTTTSSADINPITIPMVFGDHTFFIKSVDLLGNESPTASIVVVNIPVIPPVTINASVIGNFVLLSWTAARSTFLIDYYNIYKDGVLIGTSNGTFESFFEFIGGTFTYIVEPVDIVGNVGTQSAGAVVQVSDPQDYILHDRIISTLSGTKTNCRVVTLSGVDYLLACIDTTKTYENHFIDNGFTSPQDQIDAGYPIYIQPSETTGSYVEIFDFGGILTNLIVVLTWNTIVIDGSVSVLSSTIETSEDAITWSTPVTGQTSFSTSLRYVRFTMNFVGADDTSLAYFFNLQCLLNVHQEVDGGTVDVFAADVSGTEVFFNKAFKSVETITLTPVSTVQQTAIFDFSFGVNPTSFFIYLFDDAGVRVDGTVSWIARGII